MYMNSYLSEQFLNDLSEIKTLFIPLTHKCNLCCDYCFIEKKEGVISEDIAKKAIDLFIMLGGPIKVFSFTGGEPLFYIPLFQCLVKYIKSKKTLKKIVIHITTNGTKLSRKFLDYCKNERILIRVSIDGEQSHNINRKQGNYDYDYVCEKIKQADPDAIELLLTVSPATVENMYMDFLSLIKLGTKSISVKPAVNSVKWTDQDIEIYVSQLNLILKHFLRSLSRNPYDFKQVRVFLQNEEYLKFGETSYYEYPCDSDSLDVDFKGDFHSCSIYSLLPDNQHFKIGDVYTGLDVNKRAELLRKRLAIDNTYLQVPCMDLDTATGCRKSEIEVCQMEKLILAINSTLNSFHNYLVGTANKEYIKNYLSEELLQKSHARLHENDALFKDYKRDILKKLKFRVKKNLKHT